MLALLLLPMRRVWHRGTNMARTLIFSVTPALPCGWLSAELVLSPEAVPRPTFAEMSWCGFTPRRA